MKPILARVNRKYLAAFARARPLLVFDFDGTLAPIVDRPADAAMRPRTRALLGRITETYPVAVLTGRAHADMMARLPSGSNVEVVGNHGVDLYRGAKTISIEVKHWLRSLRSGLCGLRGLVLEDKGHSLAIHYRGARDRLMARRQILVALSRLSSIRILHGKQVFDVLPASAPHKGMALERLRSVLRCERAIYVGDDTTDEEIFAFVPRTEVVTIRVGRHAGSAASFYIPSQARIDDLLDLMAMLREARGTPADTGLASRF